MAGWLVEQGDIVTTPGWQSQLELSPLCLLGHLLLSLSPRIFPPEQYKPARMQHYIYKLDKPSSAW